MRARKTKTKENFIFVIFRFTEFLVPVFFFSKFLFYRIFRLIDILRFYRAIFQNLITQPQQVFEIHLRFYFAASWKIESWSAWSYLICVQSLRRFSKFTSRNFVQIKRTKQNELIFSYNFLKCIPRCRLYLCRWRPYDAPSWKAHSRNIESFKNNGKRRIVLTWKMRKWSSEIII